MSQAQLHRLCPPFLVQFLLGTPLCAARFQDNLGILQYVLTCPKCAVASTLFRTSAAVQLILLLDCWCLLRAPRCCIPRTANTQIKELQIPSIVTFQTSHTACFQCSCRCLQQKFSGAVKLADKNSSHPPHVQFGLGQNDETFSRCPSLGNCSQPVHRAEPSSPPTHDQVQFLSCISLRRLHEMLEAVPELSNLLVLHAQDSFSMTPFDQSVCHIKSAWLLVTLELCTDQTQPIRKFLETLHHMLVLSTLSPCHNSEN